MVNLFGVVAIGRNEGVRLQNCLLSALQHHPGMALVYVDSGSSDGSVEFARAQGVEVVELDLSIPFTAARARNEGVERLVKLWPDLQFVQFIDGDCEFSPQWLPTAAQVLQADALVSVVCGRLKERYPERSIYNRLCDMEWNAPVGEIKECGGIAMMRLSHFRRVSGFNPELIAGEEPELCVRLRSNGGKILRIADEMAWHDANMLHFSQWWKRSFRAGYAYAEGAWMHGKSADRHWVKESRSIWVFGFAVPLLMLAAAWPTQGLSLLLFGALCSTQAYRVYRYMRGRGFEMAHASLYAIFCILGKFPQAQGQLRFHRLRLTNQKQGIVEYKQSAPA
jgi:GT2 family glycosyltransferase